MLELPLVSVGIGLVARRHTLEKARSVSDTCGCIDKWILDQDAPYAAIAVSKEFSQVTHENTVKWETIEPQPGVFDFTAADALVDWAQKHNKKIRGHTLAWHSQLAPWVTANKYTATELKAILERHVTTVVTHFKGKIFQWDVVNEGECHVKQSFEI